MTGRRVPGGTTMPELVRVLVFEVGAASVPFLVVELFVWTRTGGWAGALPLLAQGELLPCVALLAGQGLSQAYDLPRRARATARWPVAVAAFWTIFTVSCAIYTVPFSDAAGSGVRVAAASLILLAVVVVMSVAVRRLDRGRSVRRVR